MSQPQITLINAGDGKSFPQKGQTVTAHYHGTLDNGKKFDSSYDRGKPFQFKLGMGQVIKCWDLTVAQMSIGQKVAVKCPSDIAYGPRGIPGVIPGGATLNFDIELLGYE